MVERPDQDDFFLNYRFPDVGMKRMEISRICL